MLQYILILFTLIFVLSFNPANSSFTLSGRKGKQVFELCIAFFVVLAGFRAPIVGNDTMAYIDIFNQGEDNLYNGTRFEIGYIYYNILIKNFTNNIQVFFILTSIFIYTVFGFYIWKYSTRPKLALVFFFLLSFGMSVNTMRQCIAICILLFSIECIIYRRWILFLFFVVVAGLFHNTAFLFLFAYPLTFLKIKKNTIIFFILGAIVGYVLFAELLKLAFSYFPMYEYYSDGKYFEGETRIASVVKLLFSLIIFIIAYWPYKKTSEQWKNSVAGKRYTLLLLFEMMSMFILFLSLKVNLIDRVAMYFSALSFVLLSNAIDMLPARMRRIVTISMFFLFASYSCVAMYLRPEWNRVYPIELEWKL